MVCTRTAPQDAWHALARGDDRFIHGLLIHPQQDAERRSELSAGESRNAAFFGCSDSRVAAEILSTADSAIYSSYATSDRSRPPTPAAIEAAAGHRR